MKPMVIQPEPGLPVLYVPPQDPSDYPRKLAAIITTSYGDRTVALVVFPPNDYPMGDLPERVHLRQPDDPPLPAGTGYCEWLWRFVAQEKIRQTEENMRL